MAVEKESSVDFIPETVEEEYAMLAGRLKAVEAVSYTHLTLPTKLEV